jgi:hypothetical protein
MVALLHSLLYDDKGDKKKKKPKQSMGEYKEVEKRKDS